MSLVTTQDISKSYAAQVVLDRASLQIYAGEKVGFVGANGTGKTTLMRIVAGEIQPDSGQLTRARAASLSYLPQEAQVQSGRTLREEAEDAVQHLRSMEDALQAVHDQMAETADPDELGALTAQLDQLQTEFQTSGGYDYERRIELVLQGVGFRQGDLGMRVEHMSGGQKSRAALARLLLESPDLMLLDEPTNHLDIYGVEWLESFLVESPCAALIVSHDRYFLDRVAARIVELEDCRVSSYRGNYSAHVRVKAERIARQQKEYSAQREEISRQEEYIRRYHYGQRAKEARGRQKKLDRVERVDRPVEQQTMRLAITPRRRPGDMIVTAQDLAKRFGDLQLFDGLSFEVRRGDRLGIIGPNGTGKTTLLRLLLGQEEPSDGLVRLGHGVEIGYYEQGLASLNQSKSVIDEIWDLDRQATELEVRQLLAAFLFAGDAIEKQISMLSGGEQSRVALAKLICQRPNLLMLDEPTNHLDIPSRTALEGALRQYEGTVVMVTHDRYFLNQIAQKVLWIEAGAARLYHGNYDFVVWSRNNAAPGESDELSPAQEKKQAYRERKRAARRAKSPIEKLSFEQLEKAIMDSEAKIGELEAQMADPSVYADGEKAKAVRGQYEAAQRELAELNEEWERRLEDR